MDKQQVISFISEQVALGKISKTDLLDLAGVDKASVSVSSSNLQPEVGKHENAPKNLIKVFYAIGAIIILIGVIILIVQNWDVIGFAGRVLVTLGISFLAYALGYAFRRPDQNTISQVMFTLSAALAPIGVFVLLYEASVEITYNNQIMTSLGLFVVFLVPLFITKRNILLLLSLGFVTWAYFVFVVKIFERELFSSEGEILKWAVLIAGVAYMCIGYGFRKVWMSRDESDERQKGAMQSLLYAVGTLAILGAGISFGGIWDLIVIALIFAAFYGSVYLKSRTMLVLAALFLMGHIIKLTSEYFVDSIGWPVALIAVGILIIGIGYMTFYLNRKYIGAKAGV